MLVRIEVWSDVVCPWCYIGKRHLESALDDFDHQDEVEVVYRSFELDPSAPEVPVETTVESLARKFGTDVAGCSRADDSVPTASRPRWGSSSTTPTRRTPAPSPHTGCCTWPRGPGRRRAAG